MGSSWLHSPIIPDLGISHPNPTVDEDILHAPSASPNHVSSDNENDENIMLLAASMTIVNNTSIIPPNCPIFSNVIDKVNSIIEDIVSEDNVHVNDIGADIADCIKSVNVSDPVVETVIDFTSEINPSANMGTSAFITTTSTDPLKSMNNVSFGYSSEDNVVLAHLVSRSKRAPEDLTISFGGRILVLLRRLQKANILLWVLPKVPKS